VDIVADLTTDNWRDGVRSHLLPLLSDVQQITLVHSAALHSNDTIAGLEADQFRTLLEINLVAPVVLNQLLIPHMPPGSSIIYIEGRPGF